MSAEIVDFHGHWFPPTVVDATTPPVHTPAIRASWPLLTDVDAQLRRSRAAGTAVKVVCAPLSSLRLAAIVPEAELAPRTNDAFAQAVARHDGGLAALATVDAFAGDAGAEEARRAVDELGLPGLLVDAARGEDLLGDPVTRPTLEFAAQRGLAVFAHPVNPPEIAPRYARVGGAGILLARGAESALSTLGLLAGGVLEELDGLQLVIAGIGAPALLLSAFLDRPDSGDPPPSAARARLHVDTMGFDPAVTRYLVDLLGADHVLVGSDWPIMWRDASATRVAAMLDAAGVTGSDADAISGANARRLLGLPRAATMG
jgi:predicted TIM-barrel fold metal-dependent hydrolase